MAPETETTTPPDPEVPVADGGDPEAPTTDGVTEEDPESENADGTYPAPIRMMQGRTNMD